MSARALPDDEQAIVEAVAHWVDREAQPAVDPEQAALSLLKAQLGAHPVDS